MKIAVTVTSQPPPHRVSPGCLIKPVHSEVGLDDVPQFAAGQVLEAVWEAYRSGLFDAGGCINVVIQRASERPTEGPGPR